MNNKKLKDLRKGENSNLSSRMGCLTKNNYY